MMKKYLSLFVLIILVSISCQKPIEKEQKVQIFNVADPSKMAEFGKLKLDETHENLLNPTISKDNFDVVYKSWVDLHQNLNSYLVKNGFNWGISDEKIKIFNRIYFKKNGEIKTYVYRIYNEITQEKAAEYGVLIEKFLEKEQISLTRGTDFAQCGKMSLPNTIKKQAL